MSIYNILKNLFFKTYFMTNLKIGDIAPTFSGVDENGNPINLIDYKGKKLVLYFYPKDDTPGCTAEACSLRDNYENLEKKGIKIIGVSPDDSKKHLKFIAKYSLPFTLLSDTDKVVANAYQVWGPKKFMGKSYEGINRTTFLINEQGIIDHVISDVDTKNHSEQILKTWGL
jgi:peroxiredoxin Q/BCP